MKKVYLLLLLTILTLGLLVGCGSTTDDTEQTANSNDNNTEQTEDTEEASFPVTITDGTGEKQTIEQKPERIVSVLPSNTEIAFELGLGNKIVGVSKHDNYPKEVQDIEKVGGLELNIEKIIALKPDLVLADPSNNQKVLDQLRNAGIPVLLTGAATDFQGVYDNINLIGKATGAVSEAEDVITGMKDKLAKLKEKANAIKEDERKTAFIEISPAPDIYTAGKNTFMAKLLEIIHADNAASEMEGWAKVNQEAIIAKTPDVIITTYGHFVDKPRKKVLSREGWENVAAVKNKQVINVHTDLVSRPGPRLVKGVEELGKAIYPDVFGN
ncbi:ABC transporter substrate-binding protein [Virgibacillus ihumii]|uniref:ABC transporter substrate-binding protein n=1 Tax=Virgibacillus ihumii TaxID=2686091 RepID=UPI00157DA519|nr:ABC transporter substrate-binding protein [Virgibacillus ihumii]